MRSHLLALIAPVVIAVIAQGDAPPPISWDTLPERMKWEAQQGFSGVILVARGGKTVFNEAYGLANREKSIPNRLDTIFGIGSTPIDFTKAGVLLLAQRGKLGLSDAISKYFDGVPEDKRAITIEHLMTGRSGLPDFHDIPSDRDPDHAWIDRAEAVRRILGQKLLFKPGEGQEHSHSAWGLLAAIIEIASGQSYPDFTREHLFKPAGMNDTGFFGEKYAEERMAIGYGPRKDGEINAPPYWGPTSWLVMGSGGQVSTVPDMLRWVEALRGGKLLPADVVARHWRYGDLLAGGDMYGFEILYGEGRDALFIIVDNAGGPRKRSAWRRLGEELMQLVTDRKPPRFSFGIQVEPGDDGRPVLRGVVAGSAAERDGLRAGDVLLSVGGKPAGVDDLLDLLQASLQSGEAVTFEIERGGARQKVAVKPNPRSAP